MIENHWWEYSNFSGQFSIVSSNATRLKLLRHLEAYVVQQVNDLLIVPLSFDLLRLQSDGNLVQRLSEVGHLTHRLELTQPMQHLGLDLRPLGAVVEEEELNLAHELLLPLVHVILLHLERALHVPQQQVRVVQLLVRLFRPGAYHPSKAEITLSDGVWR